MTESLERDSGARITGSVFRVVRQVSIPCAVHLLASASKLIFHIEVLVMLKIGSNKYDHK